MADLRQAVRGYESCRRTLLAVFCEFEQIVQDVPGDDPYMLLKKETLGRKWIEDLMAVYEKPQRSITGYFKEELCA